MSESVITHELIDKKNQQAKDACKKYYQKKIREDPEFYAAEKARIKEYKNDRYKTDPEFREKVKQINRDNLRRKRAFEKN